MKKKYEEFSPIKQIQRNIGQVKRVQKSNEPMQLEKLSTSAFRKKGQLSKSLLQQHDFNLVTSQKKQASHTYSKIHNQKKLKDPSTLNDMPSLSSKSLINSQDSRFAIQSQPNHLTIDRSVYFNTQETDYTSIITDSQAKKETSVVKLIHILCKLDPLVYIKKMTLMKMKKNLTQYGQFNSNNQPTIQKRQLQLIDYLLTDEQMNNENYKKINKVKIPYYNKLVGLCSPLLIKKQKLLRTDINVQHIKNQKQSASLNQTLRSQQSFIFNFQITPHPPVDCQKRIVKSSYSGMKTRRTQ